MTRDKRPERIRPMKRRHFVDIKAYIHRPIGTQDPQVANSYARDLIREVERLTALTAAEPTDPAVGEATVGEVALCNGKCHTGEYPDFDRDCPVHGFEVEECPEGCGTQRVADISVEESVGTFHDGVYNVVHLDCSHYICWPVGRRPMTDVKTGGLL